MDTFRSIHPLPAQWLRDSVLAPFVPHYWRHLVERRYASNTTRVYRPPKALMKFLQSL